ncbi:hypothetical protein PENTCL1PPCAC_4981, partial [Pristionchus entomophagus]
DSKHKRYFHKLCCYAVATKASTIIAFASLLSLFMRSIVLAISGRSYFVDAVPAVVDFLCCIELICAISRECSFLIAPYLFFQV